MSTVGAEQVLVVKTELFRECGYFQGFCDQTDRYLETLLDPNNTQYLPRSEMEEDPGFKQLIPYCIFQHIDPDGIRNIFRYTRGKGGGEARLRAKKSVGIGGHVSTLDSHDDCPYEEGMRRELEEEIQISSAYEQKLIGLLNDDSNAVGQVHLGVVHLFTLEEPSISSREAEIAEAGFEPIERLMENLDQFESWSQICLESLFGG